MFGQRNIWQPWFSRGSLPTNFDKLLRPLFSKYFTHFQVIDWIGHDGRNETMGKTTKDTGLPDGIF
jgi:hypothetical protein